MDALAYNGTTSAPAFGAALYSAGAGDMSDNLAIGTGINANDGNTWTPIQ